MGTTPHPSNTISGNCAFDPIHERQLREPAFATQQELVERKLYEQVREIARVRKRSRSTAAAVQEILTIPVVIHVLHRSSEPNPGDGISNPKDEQILAGLSHLNQAFRNSGNFQASGHNDHPAVQSVDVGIEFCLAQTDIYGQPTTGILRYESDEYSELNADLEDPEMQQWTDMQDGQAFPVTHYAHVWLVSKICRGTGTAQDPVNCNNGGYAYYPATYQQVHNGVVSLSYLWGTSEMGSKNHIHEFGHYLGLYHTFQGGCPNGDCLLNGDRVCDTPPDSRTSFGACGEPDNSCFTDADDTSANNPFQTDQDDLYENYMDYTSNTCQNTFTQGQADRMRSALTEVRSQLLTSPGCQADGVTSPNPNGSDPGGCTEEELMLMDQEIMSGVYENAETIFASGSVTTGGQVVLHASQGISFLPGFSAGKGSSMIASLQNCSAGSNATTTGQDEAGYAARTLTDQQLAPAPEHAPVDLQIAPNPVVQESTVRYYLPESAEIVSLSLLDVNGREMRRLDQPGQHTGGWQESKLSAQGLPAGMYFVMLRVDAELVSRQVMVVR